MKLVKLSREFTNIRSLKRIPAIHNSLQHPSSCDFFTLFLLVIYIAKVFIQKITLKIAQLPIKSKLGRYFFEEFISHYLFLLAA